MPSVLQLRDRDRPAEAEATHGGVSSERRGHRSGSGASLPTSASADDGTGPFFSADSCSWPGFDAERQGSPSGWVHCGRREPHSEWTSTLQDSRMQRKRWGTCPGCGRGAGGGDCGKLSSALRYLEPSGAVLKAHQPQLPLPSGLALWPGEVGALPWLAAGSGEAQPAHGPPGRLAWAFGEEAVQWPPDHRPHAVPPVVSGPAGRAGLGMEAGVSASLPLSSDCALEAGAAESRGGPAGGRAGGSGPRRVCWPGGGRPVSEALAPRPAPPGRGHGHRAIHLCQNPYE